MRMKRFLLLAALTLAWSSFWAQDVVRHINQGTPDSIPATTVPADSVAVDDEDDGPNVIGAKPTPRHKKGEAISTPKQQSQQGLSSQLSFG